MLFIGNATLDPLTIQINLEEDGTYSVDEYNEFGKRQDRKIGLTKEQVLEYYEDFDFSEVNWSSKKPTSQY